MMAICRAMSNPLRLSLWAEPVPEGMRLGWTCDVPYCGNREHMALVESGNANRRSWKEYGHKLRTLQPEEYFDIPDAATDEKSRLLMRTALNVYGVRFVLRSMPKGIRLIRVGGNETSWNQTDPEVSIAAHPYLITRQSLLLRMNGLKPGGFFLGQLWGTSLHKKDIPKYQHCHAKGCAFPANGNGEGLCRHHFHFFDYSVSRLGRHLDMDDIYGDDKEAPRFYVGWFWKHERESLKFQQGGATSWWQERVKSVEAFVGYNNEKKALNMCARKQAHPNKQEAERILKEMAVGPKPGAAKIHTYLCPDCSQWHIGNQYTFASEMARGRVDMRASIPGLHRGVSGLHHGEKPNRRIGGGKASQSNKRRKAAAENRVGNKRTAHDPDKRWSREGLEAEADKILAASGFFDVTSRPFDETPKASPISYMATEPDLDEEQERDLIIADLSKQQDEFAEIFGE